MATARDAKIIDLHLPQARCCICGELDLSNWGIPVNSETAEIVPNDFEGEWGGIPACEKCHGRHARGEFVGTYPRF